MSDEVYSDVGISNGSFVDHLWICLLDQASGYVDKSFRKNSVHNCFMRGFQNVPAHCDYRYIALPRRFAGFARSPVCSEHCFFLMSVFTGNFRLNLPCFLNVRSYPKYTSYVCFNALPSRTAGQINWPSSRRLVNRHRPSASAQSILTVSPVGHER